MKKWRAKKDALPKELRNVLLGTAPGVYTEEEFLEVRTEQPEKEDAPTVAAVEIRAKVRELGIEEWYQPEYLCRNCGGTIMACDAENMIVVPKRCPICEAKLELEDDTPASCDECSWASKLYRSCTCCPRYKKLKENEKEET